MRKLSLLAAGLAVAGAWALTRRAPEDLSGQVALVTGGSRGLGLLIARELALQGCRVAICARDPEELDRARQDLEDRGAEVLAIPCDVSKRLQVERMVTEIVARFGRLDLLVNNAGIIQVGPLSSMTAQDFEEAMAINFYGSLYTTFAALPHLRRGGGGRIVNIDSIGGRVSVPHMLPYNCAKFALRGFSEGLRAELTREGILVTTVIPGLMRTGSPLHARFKGDRDLEYAWFSLADNLKATSIDAGIAARRIVLAARRGEAELTLTWQARLLGTAHDLFPQLTMAAFDLAERLLPKGEGLPRAGVEGRDLAPPLVPQGVARRLDDEARRYNQLAPEEPSPVWAEPIEERRG